MINQTYTTAIRGSLGVLSPPAVVISGDLEEVVAVTVDMSDTVVETVAVDVSKVVAFYMVSDKDITVTTNSGADQSFELTANKPFFWNTDSLGANPLTTDITELHFVNANLVAANVKAEFLLVSGV